MGETEMKECPKESKAATVGTNEVHSSLNGIRKNWEGDRCGLVRPPDKGEERFPIAGTKVP
jgi:hypothetical protein